MNVLQQAAYLYAKLGWAVFPLLPGDKRPFPGSNGVKDATNDPDAVAEIWRRYPTANIGLACGAVSGVYVVDIDVDQEKGKNGFITLSELGIVLPATIYQDTPRGGRHLFFTSDTEIRNATDIVPGVDVRGDGGYVVVAPSARSDGRAYKWDDVLHPWNARPLPYPDNMPKARVKSNRVQPAPVLQGSRAVPSLHDDDYRRRVMAYIEKIEPAVAGQGGQGRLMWFFQCTINGMCLPKSEAIQLGWQYFNPRCDPPWEAGDPKDYWEFTRKADEAEKCILDGYSYGWIRDDPEFNIPQLPDDFDLQGFIDAGKKAAGLGPVEEVIKETAHEISTRKKMLKADAELEFLCQPHGLVGDVAAFINQNAIYPQHFLSVAASLTFLGAVFGRKVRDARDIRTNLYTIGIGPSSCGKNNALSCIRKLAIESGHFDHIGGDEVTGAAAIETYVHANPSTMFLWDEIGFLLKTTKGRDEHKATMIPFLMKAYSCADSMYKGKSYADADKQKIIVQPCISFYGTSTIETFRDGISLDDLENGWISRVLMFSADANPRYREATYSPPPEALVEALRAWKKVSVPQMTDEDGFAAFANAPAGSKGEPIPQPFMFETEAKAEAEFLALREFARNYDGPTQALWLKAEELARRVALIMAAGRSLESRTVAWIDAHYAVRLVRYCINDFIDNVSSGVGGDLSHKYLQRTLELVRKAGISGILHSRLANRCTRWRREFYGIIKYLLDSEDIFALKKGKGTYYWHAEHKALYEEAMAKCTQKNS